MKVIDHNASGATVELSAPELDAIGRAMFLAVHHPESRPWYGGERGDQVLAVGRKLSRELLSLDLDMGDDADDD